MILQPGGIDVFYIDESHDTELYAVTAVAVPFLRCVDGIWQITWPAHLDAAKSWRRTLSATLKIPATKELHGVKLAGGRGNYVYGGRQFTKPAAIAAYRTILSLIGFFPDASVITVVGRRGQEM